jgi:predicted nucleotidyltransferase
MTSFLNRYTVNESRPLDQATLHILSVVNRLAGDLELPYIVVGATARDLLLFHVFGIPVTRATADVDFAIAVDSWERFRGLRTALLASGHFDEGKIEHRIYLKAPSAREEIPVDLIHFGGVAQDDVIRWPPNRETIMTVAGFEDAIAAAVQVQVSADLTVPVASLAGIARRAGRNFPRQHRSKSHGTDPAHLCRWCNDPAKQIASIDEATQLLEQAEYDIELGGAALLGFDARQLCSPHTLAKVRILLALPNFAEKLAERIRLSKWPLQPERLLRVLSVLSRFTGQLAL